jgi:hypothetical protein
MVNILDYIDKMQVMYGDKDPSSTVPGPRNMFADGQLVRPSGDGSRPGYQGKDKFTVGSGPGTGDALTSDRNTKIVKSALNKIKKQINNKPYFEWSEKSDWYKKLRTQLGGKAEGFGMNRDFTNQLINKVVNENFPGAYHGRSAIANLRRDIVVEGFVGYLKDNGEFDGGEKFLKSIEKFKDNKRPDNRFENINKAWKSWIAGEFEVEGVDRTQLAKELKARGISYNQIDKWNAKASQERGLKKKAAIEFLDNQNNKFPNRSFENVEKLYKEKFPNRNIYLDVNTLTDIKRTGIYKSGDSTTSKYKSVSKGNRANWLKESYGKQFQGNYSKLIKAADELEAAGEFKKAKRISVAADKFFGPNGIITNAKGEGEHALARTFDLLNPDRQLAVNSLVSGDLNQFKKNFFDVPVKRYFDEYNNPNTTSTRRKELKTLIEDRKKTMNSLTGGQTKGIVAGDTVKFQYKPNKIVATSNVEAIDTAFKKGRFNIDDYVAKGTAYSDAFKVAGSEAKIFTKTGDIKSTYSKPINEKKATALKQNLLKLAGTVNPKCRKAAVDGGRIGFQDGLSADFCINEGKKVARDLTTKNIKASPAQNLIMNRITSGVKNFAKSILDPNELFDFKKQFLSKGALIGAVGIDAIFAADDALRKDMDPKEAFAKTLFFGTIPSAAGFTDNVDVLNAKKMLENPSLSPAGKEYAQLIIDSTNLSKGQSDTGIVESFKTLTEGPTNQFKNLQELKDKVSNTSTSGRFDYENALAEMQSTFKAKPKENKFFFDDAPDAPDVTPLTNKLATPAKSRGPMTEKKKQKIDLSPVTYQNFKPNYGFTKEQFEDAMRKEGALADDQIYTDAFYKQEIEKPIEFQQLMELPSFRGASQNFAGGGIAGLSGGDPEGAMTKSMNPDSQGLRSLYKNGRKL